MDLQEVKQKTDLINDMLRKAEKKKKKLKL
jgi:hypothetical protein